MSRRFFVVKDPQRPLVNDYVAELLELTPSELVEPFELEIVLALRIEKLRVDELFCSYIIVIKHHISDNSIFFMRSNND